MSDPTLFALAFIGLVFAAGAAARALLRVALIADGMIRELIREAA